MEMQTFFRSFFFLLSAIFFVSQVGLVSAGTVSGIIKLDGKSMTYNLKDNLLNPEFIVSANKNISQKLLSLMK